MCYQYWNGREDDIYYDRYDKVQDMLDYREDCANWFNEFYRIHMSKILPLDNIEINSYPLDFWDKIIVKGIQHYSTCSDEQYAQAKSELKSLCDRRHIQIKLLKHSRKNSDEFTVTLTLYIPYEPYTIGNI